MIRCVLFIILVRIIGPENDGSFSLVSLIKEDELKGFFNSFVKSINKVLDSYPEKKETKERNDELSEYEIKLIDQLVEYLFYGLFEKKAPIHKQIEWINILEKFFEKGIFWQKLIDKALIEVCGLYNLKYSRIQKKMIDRYRDEVYGNDNENLGDEAADDDEDLPWFKKIDISELENLKKSLIVLADKGSQTAKTLLADIYDRYHHDKETAKSYLIRKRKINHPLFL